VVYSDATPGITNTYGRLGRKSSVLCGGTTTTWGYDLANEVLSESYSGGVLDGLGVTNGYAAFLRRTYLTGLGSGVLARTAGALPAVVPSRTVFGYDAASLLASVSDGKSSAACTHLTSSALVDHIVFAHSGFRWEAGSA